jgi:hypothetical protein
MKHTDVFPSESDGSAISKHEVVFEHKVIEQCIKMYMFLWSWALCRNQLHTWPQR